jgi:hypothetical protein
MSVGQKVLVGALVAVVMVFASWGMVFAAVWTAGGLVTVAVDPGDRMGEFKIAVPMAVIEGAVLATRTATNGEPFAHLDAEFGEWGPLVREVLSVLDDMPSATLVEVVERDTRVRIAKRGGRLVVDVDDVDVSVQVSMPVRPAVRTLQRLLA